MKHLTTRDAAVACLIAFAAPLGAQQPASRTVPVTAKAVAAKAVVATKSNAAPGATTGTPASGATATTTAAAPGAASATPARGVPVDSMSRKEQLGYRREVFAYEAAGRRDPFVSLATTGVLRPTIADLSLVGIAYATRNAGGGAQSIAIFRDRTTKEQYRVRVGQPLGRMRVASIEPRRVTFSIDEFGISRQESIAMGDSTRTITPTRAP